MRSATKHIGFIGRLIGEKEAHKDSLRDLEEKYSGEGKAMFLAKDLDGNQIGFLACRKDENGGVVVDHINADNDNADVIRDLINQAMSYCREKNVAELTVRISEKNDNTKHVLHNEFDLHEVAVEGREIVYKGYVKTVH